MQQQTPQTVKNWQIAARNDSGFLKEKMWDPAMPGKPLCATKTSKNFLAKHTAAQSNIAELHPSTSAEEKKLQGTMQRPILKHVLPTIKMHCAQQLLIMMHLQKATVDHTHLRLQAICLRQ